MEATYNMLALSRHFLKLSSNTIKVLVANNVSKIETSSLSILLLQLETVLNIKNLKKGRYFEVQK